jgi:hypothetical protein
VRCSRKSFNQALGCDLRKLDSDITAAFQDELSTVITDDFFMWTSYNIGCGESLNIR